jgi:phenol 2-monooxygenase
VQVTLQHLNAPNGQEDTEVVHAKFVVGADGTFPIMQVQMSESESHSVGAHSWVRRTMGIAMEGEQTGNQLSSHITCLVLILVI